MESDLVLKNCKVCNTPTVSIINMLGRTFKVPVMCDCESKEYEKRKEDEVAIEQMQRLEKLRNHSLMDNKFYNCTFENFEIDKSNKYMFDIGRKYVSNFNRAKEENIGLMLFGPTGTGKTFIAFCIANELINKLTPVIAISSIGLLNKIKETYGRYGNEGEVQIINSLKNASLLILDDLGAENNTSWSKEKLYEIIDSRYRDGKPIIITTNLSREQLRDKLTGEDGVYRTYDRIIEMCTPVEVKGKARRIEAAKAKQDVIREIFK